MLRFSHWSIAGRSAIVAGSVVVIALAVTGAGLAGVLYQSLTAGVDAAASARVRDVATGLEEDTPADLDSPLLATDQRVEAVQVISPDGKVVGRSDSAPTTPLVPISTVGTSLRTGMSPVSTTDGDVRVSGQTVSTANGRFTILVAGGNEAVESAMTTAAVLLLCAAPIITAVSALVSYRLVRRSLRSVDAIRAQVAAISVAGLVLQP